MSETLLIAFTIINVTIKLYNNCCGVIGIKHSRVPRYSKIIKNTLTYLNFLPRAWIFFVFFVFKEVIGSDD